MLRRVGHRFFLVAGSGLVAAYFVVGHRAGDVALYTAIGWAAFAALVAGILVHRPPAAGAWWLLAASQAAWAAADLVWQLADGPRAFPSAADAVYLAGYALLGAALVTLGRSLAARADRGDLVDAAIVAIAAGVLAWPWILHPHVMATEPLPALVAVAYPVFDIFLLALLARMSFDVGPRSPAIRLVAASVALVLVSDLAYATPALTGTYDLGSWRDAGWLGAYVLIGAGALHPSVASPAAARAPGSLLPLGRLAVVGGALLAFPAAALVMLARGPLDGHDRIALVGAAFAMVVLVLLRVGMLLVQLERVRRTAEASERKFRAIFDSAGVGISIGLDGRMTETNEAYQRMLGYGGDELARMHYLDVTHPDDVELTLATEALRPGERRVIEKRYVRSDGSTFWANVTLSHAQDGGFGIGIVEDVTERRRLEEELRQAQKMEAVGQLAGGIAHDFNNLLTAVSGYAELALARLAPGDRTRSDVEEIARAARRAAELTQQLLAFSRRQVLRADTVDLNAAVASAGSLLRRLIGTDVELVTDLAPALPAVRADPTLLEQVVVNLAVNARDAMPGGGRLSLATRAVELTPAEAAERELAPGAYVVLEVTDTGCGMDADTLAHAFEPFFTTKPPGHGSGLGLSMVYGSARQSGGTAELESAPEAGTAVRIFLPQADAGSVVQATPAVPPQERSTRSARRVLLVEDDPVVAALVREVLEADGHRVVHAEDGRQGIVLAESEGPFDLLVTDLVMPHVSGRRVADEVTARSPGTVVLFISGYPGDEVVARGLLDPGTPFVEKPFALAALRERVDALLGERDRAAA